MWICELFGHNYQPIFDYKEEEPRNEITAKNIYPNDLLALVKASKLVTKIYHKTICTRCGNIIDDIANS